MPEDVVQPHIKAGSLKRVLEDWCPPFPWLSSLLSEPQPILTGFCPGGRRIAIQGLNSTRSPQAGQFLFHLDNDLAFCPARFDVSHGLIGFGEREDSIHDRAYDPGIDERRDLAQLTAARFHENK